MPSIGPVEIVVVAAIALIVFGPERLPEIARNIGKAIQELRRMASDVREEFDLTIEEETPPKRTTEPESPPIPEEENPEAPPLARIKDESPDEEDRA
jgi:sec-independent protein translocase protein TatA